MCSFVKIYLYEDGGPSEEQDSRLLYKTESDYVLFKM
jgi:hypothetical protein